jgi:hypothetical protein
MLASIPVNGTAATRNAFTEILGAYVRIILAALDAFFLGKSGRGRNPEKNASSHDYVDISHSALPPFCISGRLKELHQKNKR